MSNPQLTFKVAADLNKLTIEDLLCGYAGKLCWQGSLLRECTIAGHTSCEYFNDANIAPKCFIKTNHENYQKTILELEKANKKVEAKNIV